MYGDIKVNKDGEPCGVYGGGTGIKRWTIRWKYRNTDGVYVGGKDIKMNFTVQVQE